MRIKKIYQGELPENKILNVQSESSTDTYSCDYINNLGVGGGDALDELPIGSVIRYDGEDIPEGWEEVESYNDDVYSEEEIVIGTWFGKPLYRKTLSSTELVNSTTILSMPHGIDNIDKLWIDNSTSYLLSVTGVCYTLPVIGYGGNTTDRAYAYTDNTNVYIYANGGWNTGWLKVVTLLYTKTTD